jgi:microcystin-dependent protein
MSSFVGEIRVFAFGYAPAGWMECAGQKLQVQQYMSLYSVIGNQYGGEGMMSFCLPNLSSDALAGGKSKYYIAVEGEFPERQ